MSSTIRRGPREEVEETDREVAPDETSVYADMKALLGAKVEDKILELPVPSRQTAENGLIAKYNATFDFDTFNKWLKQATPRGKKQVDPKNLAIIVLRNTNCGFMVERKGVRTEFLIAGEPQTFASPAIQEMVGTLSGVPGTIISMYSNDGHMLLTMNRVINEAGYAEMDLDDVEGYDPLER